MYAISHQLYVEFAERLAGAIGSKEFFSGGVSCISGDVECRLICTLMVHHDMSSDKEHPGIQITRLIPIWWEFHTVVGGEEIMNDFSFSELCEIALN
jgi:hypothetical protein